MKREIKFRAWDEDAEEMIYSQDGEKDGWWEVYPIRYGYVSGTTGGNQFEPPEPVITYLDNIMQFTGLKDSKNREIYEGDILHIEYFKLAVGDNLGVYDLEAELTGVIEFDDLSLVLQNIAGERWSEYTGYDAGEGSCRFVYLGDVYEGSSDASYQIEVIGNIYENPELL